MKESDRVEAVVAYFPPVDLRPLGRGLNPPAGDTVLDRYPALNFEKEKAADYSPIVFVTSDDPPTLLIHGDKDDLVNISNSQIIFEAFKKNNDSPGAGEQAQGIFPLQKKSIRLTPRRNITPSCLDHQFALRLLH
jgi:hypothetical protein